METTDPMARRKASSAADKPTPEMKALMEIVNAYDALKNSERSLKDAKATALAEAKNALQEVDESIKDSREVDPSELPLKVNIILTCWQAYQETKITNKKIIEDKTAIVKADRETLERAIKDTRQGKLDFEGDGDATTNQPVNAVVDDGAQAQAQA